MIRLRFIRNLIFFAALLSNCTSHKDDRVALVWLDNEAVGLSVPLSLISSVTEAEVFNVRVKGQQVMMLGDIDREAHQLIFRPLIPLTRGLSYEVVVNEKVVAEVSVPMAEGTSDLDLLIYPSQDTVPENLLKVYLRFSRPMEQGRALTYITLLNEQKDTVRGTFLDLKPELWNDRRDMLTVWLDPGRIKRGLHPNHDLGQPLVRGRQYSLIVSRYWKDINGLPLGKDFVKSFLVAGRDSLSPVPSAWKIEPPKSNTTDNLCVRFHEPVDYSLLNGTLHVYSSKVNSRDLIRGVWTFSEEETVACFKPQSEWKAGAYMLEIETRLEDLSGNNLSRPFERDMTVAERDVRVSPGSVALPFQPIPSSRADRAGRIPDE
ncbi:Ig-like domain-containing protein [Chryseolinea sp. T2]|uniref:Ig-like domain-containing protein n=1 Tax=Chryseolinea sp. T2 TaxID=3129255 RepID=UPI0030778F6E